MEEGCLSKILLGKRCCSIEDVVTMTNWLKSESIERDRPLGHCHRRLILMKKLNEMENNSLLLSDRDPSGEIALTLFLP